MSDRERLGRKGLVVAKEYHWIDPHEYVILYPLGPDVVVQHKADPTRIYHVTKWWVWPSPRG